MTMARKDAAQTLPALWSQSAREVEGKTSGLTFHRTKFGGSISSRRTARPLKKLSSVLGKPDEESIIEKETDGWPRQPEELAGGRHWYFSHASQHSDVHVEVSTKAAKSCSYRAKNCESHEAVSEDDFIEAEKREFSTQRGSSILRLRMAGFSRKILMIPVQKQQRQVSSPNCEQQILAAALHPMRLPC